ncbi:hypothetical protein C8R43DRAFT_1143727 [Mycena crocata]|nr:hypothetical protein C8R43DRAFT_1143727 [Mycena crocata]
MPRLAGNTVLSSEDELPALAKSIPPALPPLSSDGIIASSQIIGTREERLATIRRKSHRKRAATIATQKVETKQLFEENKIIVFDEILAKLSENGLTFGQLMLYVFDPIYKQGSTRWDEQLLSSKESALRALSLSMRSVARAIASTGLSAASYDNINMVFRAAEQEEQLLALSFRGNGRSKYAYEMLHLIHNITHVWPKLIRNIILNNWLLNPTGNPCSWVEVHLMQEHMTFWVKLTGSAASWEWLGMVAPCVTALCHLSTSISEMLGSQQGTKHEPANLVNDIKLFVASLTEHDVYKVKGCVFAEGDEAPTP